VADDPELKIEIVLKLIRLGSKSSKSRDTNQTAIEKEMKVGMLIAKECSHLISYWEFFEWEDYFCIKMEYCEKGDIQKEFDKGRIFSEEVKFFLLI
jgi:serine/threonine protein kinase